MRMLLKCKVCEEQNKDCGSQSFVLYSADLLDQGIVRFQCEKSHASLIKINAHKFELLAELGANAILDGYRREAVSSFTSALERFQEFYVRIAATAQELTADTFDAAWRQVSRQSERQFGAFVFVYTTTEGRPPPTLSNKNVEFRNEVIHKGVIPTEQEAIDYAQAVIDVINPALEVVATKHASLIRKLEYALLIEGASRRSQECEQPQVMSMDTLLKASRKSGVPFQTVDQWMQQQKQLRDRVSHLRVVPGA
jgi:hypothetical protein